MNKAIFLDLDGTVCITGQDPSTLTLEAIRNAQSRGHKVFLCTGRSLAMLPTSILTLGWDGIISGVGSHITVDGCVLQNFPFDNTEVARLTDIMQQAGIAFIIQTAKFIYMPLATLDALALGPNSGINHETANVVTLAKNGKILDWSAYQGDAVYNIAFLSAEDAGLAQLTSQFGSAYRQVIHPAFIPGAVTNIEIVRHACNKGNALRTTCKACGIPVQNSIAVGDSTNDIEMLQSAGFAIAMGNGDATIKAYADFVCGDIQEDGLYHAFRDLGLF